MSVPYRTLPSGRAVSCSRLRIVRSFRPNLNAHPEITGGYWNFLTARAPVIMSRLYLRRKVGVLAKVEMRLPYENGILQHVDGGLCSECYSCNFGAVCKCLTYLLTFSHVCCKRYKHLLSRLFSPCKVRHLVQCLNWIDDSIFDRNVVVSIYLHKHKPKSDAVY